MEHRNNKNLTVFVTGLCGLFKASDLKDYFSNKCDGIVSVSLPNKRKAGYAFVETANKKSLKELLKLKQLNFNGRELLLRRFLKGQELEKFKDEVNSRRLFVYSIPKNWVDEDLRELFATYGNIEDAYVIRDRYSKKSRCFGYAIFEEKSVAEWVARKKDLTFKGYLIKVKMHEPKNQKRSRNRGRKFEREANEDEASSPLTPLTRPAIDERQNLRYPTNHLDSDVRVELGHRARRQGRKKERLQGRKKKFTFYVENEKAQLLRKEIGRIKNSDHWINPVMSEYIKKRMFIRPDYRHEQYVQRRPSRMNHESQSPFRDNFGRVKGIWHYKSSTMPKNFLAFE